MDSMLTRFNGVLPFIHPDLITEKSIQSIQEITKDLPAFGIPMLEFEPGNKNKSDFGVILINPKEFEAYSNIETNPTWETELDSQWQKVKKQCAQMKLPLQPFSAITLAYDIPLNFPWIYYTLNPNNIGVHKSTAIINQTIRSEAHDQNREILERIISQFPNGINTLHFAHIPVREKHQLRIVFSPFYGDYSLSSFMRKALKELDFGSSIVLQSLFHGAEFCQLSLDLQDNKVLPEIGFEFWINRNQTNDIIDNLLSPLNDSQRISSYCKNFLSNDPINPRWLSHIKLTLNNLGETKLKIYFGFR